MTRYDSPDGLLELADMMHGEEPPIGAEEERPRRRRWGGLVAAIVFVLLLISGGGYVAWTQLAPVSTPALTARPPEVSVPPATSLALPTEGASAISISGADEYLGEAAAGILATSGANDPRPIASITKIVTALVILTAHPLGAGDAGPTITFDKADSDLYDKYYVLGATIAAMPTGSSMSLRDALSTMLIPSASNYAEAVATWAFGSSPAFVRAAREWLAANGLTGTTIVEPTGIDRRNVSTPSDLLAIAKLAAAHPVIAEIARTPSVTFENTGPLYTTNGLLGRDGITGLKTGNLGENTYSLLYTASLDVGLDAPISVTGTMLGGSTRDAVNNAVLGLLASIRSGFHTVPLGAAGDEVGTYTTPWGETARIVLGEDASIFTWSDTPIVVSMDTTTPDAYEDGENVGTLTWTAGPQTETVSIEVEGEIDPPTAWWRLTNPGQLG